MYCKEVSKGAFFMTATKFKPNSDTIDGSKTPRKARKTLGAYPRARFIHGTFHASKA